MANRQRAEARRKAQAKAARRGQRIEGSEASAPGITINLWVVVVIVVALVTGGIIWAASSGGGDSADGNGSATDDTVVAIPDSQPVTVTGDALVPYDSANADDPAIGVAAPLLSGFDFEGDAIAVDPAASGPYMVVFLAHWCPHCNAEVPRLLDWKGSGAVPSELNVLGVATAVSESSPNYPPHEWFSNRGWSWPVLVDESRGNGEAGKAAQAYGATGWPYFVIVGADGLVKARMSGEVAVSELQVIVDQALAS